jgi:signal transduction histidine kinase
METVTFSKRLSGVLGMLIFLGLNASTGISKVRHLEVNGTPQGVAWMVLGLIAFTAAGTLGWRYCLNRRLVSWMRVYFTFQVILFMALFWLENADTRNGVAFVNLSVILFVQACVLPWRTRGVMYSVIIIGTILISAAFLPTDRVILQSIPIAFTSATSLLIGHLIVSEERARDLLKESNLKLTEYAAQVEEMATVKERNRMAREIHDNIGHYLTAVNMQIEAARAIMAIDPERAQQSLAKAQTLTKEGLAEIRRSVSALRINPIDARPLHEAIELLVEEHRTSGLDVSYQVEGAIRPVSAAVEITLYRIAQEALTNIRKHAHATHADLILHYADEQHVKLKIDDNGSGRIDKGAGFGLVGIQERLNVLGGTLNIHSGQGQGFTLLAQIPT